ncbi:hypothetical protein [Kitasatospora viridis]|uniref:Uncharacterized protein n=1 Tax=Kitasatospora viridis TaxID=281105 RepID=A0A561SAC0_9ACTN|nr:hypothetical protein [Kitasatospora viridis]TWF71754.1 hypothetical protein FHX73_18125 [Kitasatospora viridis]
MSPKHQSTASRRARQAAQSGAKFTTALLPAEPAEELLSDEEIAAMPTGSPERIAAIQARERAVALTAVCSADTTGPFTLRVLDPKGGADLVHLTYDWDDFRPASAGHRLIEHGYMVLPSRHSGYEQVAGWTPAPGKDWSQFEPGNAQEWVNLVLPTNR